MGLVDYSDSESDSDVPAGPPRPPPSTSTSTSTTPTPAPPSTSKPSSFLARPPKTTVPKLIDRSTGKLVVDLSSLNTAAEPEAPPPPTKRARTGPSSFSNFNALLPAPKNRAPSKRGGLKTSAEPGFARGSLGGSISFGEGPMSLGEGILIGEGVDNEYKVDDEKSTGPAIPAGQKRPEDVKFVGKPLAFKPLSVSRKSIKKAVPPASKSTSTFASTPASAPTPAPTTAPPPPKRSLFSFAEPTFEPDPELEPTNPEPVYQPVYQPPPQPTPHDPPQESFQESPQPTLATIAADLNLSASDRRALLGRNPTSSTLRVVDMSAEYDHNDALRAAGTLQPTHQPVRAMQPGKHNVRQMINMVHSQREALEESFARDKGTKREASSRYGW